MNPNILKALEIMGYGVLAIFIVITILIVLVMLFRYFDNKGKNDTQNPDKKPLSEKFKQKAEAAKAKFKSFKKPNTPPDDTGNTKI